MARLRFVPSQSPEKAEFPDGGIEGSKCHPVTIYHSARVVSFLIIWSRAAWVWILIYHVFSSSVLDKLVGTLIDVPWLPLLWTKNNNILRATMKNSKLIFIEARSVPDLWVYDIIWCLFYFHKWLAPFYSWAGWGLEKCARSYELASGAGAWTKATWLWAPNGYTQQASPAQRRRANARTRRDSPHAQVQAGEGAFGRTSRSIHVVVLWSHDKGD